MNSNFNITRVGHLLKKDVITNYKVLALGLMGLFVIVSIMVMNEIDIHSDSRDRDFHFETFPFIILLGGFVVASVAFNELHTPNQRHVFLNLPASNFEKFLSKWLLSTLIFAIVIVVSYWVFSLILDALVSYQFDYDFIPFNPFQEDVWLAIKLFFILQPIFLIGSIYFNQYSFLKTAGTIILVGAVTLLIGYVLAFVILGKYFDGFEFKPRGVVPSANLDAFMEGTFTDVVKFLFWYCLAPFLWVVAYFKLKEREV